MIGFVVLTQVDWRLCASRGLRYGKMRLEKQRQFPIVTIVTPSFNQGEYIRETIESVIRQEGDFFIDYVIMDGGSTDTTVDVLKRYDDLLQNAPITLEESGVIFRSVSPNRGVSLRWSSEKDRGQSHAINKGTALGIGDYWGWLCSDDRYNDNRCFDALVRSLQANTSDLTVVGVYGDATFIHENGEFAYKHTCYHRNLTRDDLKLDWPVAQPSALWRLKSVREVGILREDLNLGMDLELFLRLLGKNNKILYIDRIVSQNRLQPNAKTVRLAAATARNALEIVKSAFGNAGENPDDSVFFRHLVSADPWTAIWICPRMFPAGQCLRSKTLSHAVKSFVRNNCPRTMRILRLISGRRESI